MLAAFTIDMLFLPMFHAGPVPIKVSYFVILGQVLPLRRSSLHMRLACWLLAAMCVLGGLWLHFLEPKAGTSETIRNSVILALLPLAYAFGVRARAASLQFLIALIPLYLLINAAVTFWYDRLPWLIRFYGLEAWITSNRLLIRSPGIHFNPNLSGLAMNLMLLLVVVGEQSGAIQVTARTRWVLFSCAVAMHLMDGSRGEMLSAVAIGGYWLYDAIRRRSGRRIPIMRLVLVGGTTAAAAFVLLTFALNTFAEHSSVVAFARQQFTETVALIPRESLSDSSTWINSAALRPFMEAHRYFARFLASPLIGTGFDAAPREPFTETFFHNDFAAVLVAGGLPALALLLSAFWMIAKVSPVMIAPVFVTAASNSLLFAPQHALFYFAIAGFAAGVRLAPRYASTIGDTSVSLEEVP